MGCVRHLPTGVASSKVTLNIRELPQIIAHYIPSTEDTDGDGVMDWFELYQFGNLASGPADDSDGDGFSNKREGELGQEATIAEFTEAGGIAGRMSNTFSYADTSMVLATITSRSEGIYYRIGHLQGIKLHRDHAKFKRGDQWFPLCLLDDQRGPPVRTDRGVPEQGSATITADTIFTAHYIPSTEDTRCGRRDGLV